MFGCEVFRNFGKINLLTDISLTENIFGLIKGIDSQEIKKEPAECLLTGLVLYTENFKNKLTADVFEIAGKLMKNGAELQTITENIK